MAVARASRHHPMVLTMLSDGRLHLTAIGMLAPYLTLENRARLLERATHRSKRQIEELIAEIAPRPDVRATVRKLPERSAPTTTGLVVVPNLGERPMLELGPDQAFGLRLGPTLELRPDGVGGPDRGGAPMLGLGHPPAVAPAFFPSSPSLVQPLSPGRYKVQFTASAELHHKLERLRALMGSTAG